MLKQVALVSSLLALMATGCVEHYEFKYLTDSAVSSGTDVFGADGLADIALPDLVIDPDSLTDVPGDVGPELSSDLSDLSTPEVPDSIISDQVDLAETEIVDLMDEEVPCIPECDGLECGDDGCEGSCGTCDDGNNCTTDECEEGICVFPPQSGEECPDVNPCTSSEGTCNEGICEAAQLPLGNIDDFEECWCTEDSDCEQFDTNACDTSTMVCDLELDSEGNPHCLYATVEMLNCDDGFTCTDDSCNEATGCVHLADDGKCDQSNPCQSGACSATEGCVYTDVPDVECEDGSVCTQGDTCEAGICEPGGEALDCEDAFGCTDDSCDAIAGCAHNPDDAKCDDSNPCTDDTCDPEKGCLHENNVAPCDDQAACTLDDICAGSICSGIPQTCSDDNECTLDSCNPDDGDCQFEPVADEPAKTCDDEDDLCTTDNGLCVAGECVGEEIDCDDANPCTDDSCGLTGCTYVPNDLACDDENDCTIGDSCAASECVPGEEIDVACLDYDHDGLANGVDSCPLAFDGKELDNNLDGAKDACELVKVAPPMARALNFHVNELSPTSRRTHEVVDVPLVNGLADHTARGYLPLDGDASMPYEKGEGGATLIGTTPAKGVFNDPSGALYFGGEDAIFFGDIQLPDVTTICFWMAPDEVHDFAFGATFPSGIAAKFDFKGEVGEFTVLLRSSPIDSFLLTTTESTKELIFDGDWHQVCYRWDVLVGAGDIFLDGKLWPSQVTTLGSPVMSMTPLSQWYIGAVYDGQVGIPISHYKGKLDEMLVTNRVMTPGELEAYYRSNAPFATPLVPGAQLDFDDVRIVDEGSDGNPIYRRSRIVGIRQHSDSPCPDGTSPASYPHREDLCGVVAYWRMGNELDGVVGNYHLTSDFGIESREGRFADEEGSTAFHGGGDLKSVTVSASTQLKDDDLAMELWYFVRPDDLSGGYLMGLPASPTEQVLELRVAENGDIEWTIETSDGAVTLQASGGLGRWVHVALNYDGTEAVLFVDGFARDDAPLTGTLTSTSLPMYIGASGPLDELKGKAIIDDVLIHDGAKSNDYFFSRTHPVLPSVRFLAATTIDNAGAEEAPQYPARDYLIGWGDEEATLVTPYVSSAEVGVACHGFLNRCLGYVGWWTFDDFEDVYTPDLSNPHLHAELVGNASPVAGVEGMSVLLSEESLFEVDYVPLMQSEKFTIESLSQGGSGTLLARGMGGLNDVFNYRLSIQSDGEILAEIETDDETNISAKSDAIYGDGSFHAVAATYGGAQLLAFLDGETVGGIETSVKPGTTTKALWLGATKANSGAAVGIFSGLLDEVRVMNRALARDELTHFPRLRANPGGFLGSDGSPLDSDNDGILDDGDGSFKIGDNPCVGGITVNCDDNAVDTANKDQADEDSDGVGTVVDNCPDHANPGQADHDNNDIGDACDPSFLQDWDHDGFFGDDDPCPFAFDGAHIDYDNDGDPDACKPWLEGYESGHSVWIDNGGAMERRTSNEVVELALKSGTLDASTLIYLPFENETLQDESPNSVGGLTVENGLVIFQPGPNGQGDAIALGNGCLTFPELFAYPAKRFTVMAWVETGDNAIIFDDAEVEGDEAFGIDIRYGNGSLEVTLGDGTATCSKAWNTQPWNGGDWHHVAFAYHGGNGRLVIDGVLQMTLKCEFDGIEDDGFNPSVGCENSKVESVSDHRTDEFMLFSRSLSLREIADYYNSNRPYGSSLVPGAQSDFDDVRIMEHPYEEETGKEYVTRTRLIGVREHSDSTCPQMVPDGTMAARDDLCGVEGYWKLDWALGEEVVHGDSSPLKAIMEGQNPFMAFGRYGSPNGGIRFNDRNQSLTVPNVSELNPGMGSFTTEAWLRVPDPSVGSVLYPVDKVDQNSNGYQITYVVSSGFAGCQWFGDAGQMIVIGANTTSLNDGQWHHLGCVLDRTPGQNTVGILYVDGLEAKRYEVEDETDFSTTLSSPTDFRIGWGNHAGALSQELDDVLYHSVAKSADYFFNRARPAVPRMRFLANSTTVAQGLGDPPEYPLRGYEIRWGNGGAEAMQPMMAMPGSDEVCFGLVNECLGYVGWWRLDDPDSMEVFDSGPHHHSGDAVGSMYWQFANGQFGLANNASPGSITILNAPHLATDQGTWETIFTPGLDIDGSVPGHMILFHRWADGASDNYATTLTEDGTLMLTRSSIDGTNVKLVSQQDTWFQDHVYHTAFNAGNGNNSFAVDYQAEPETSEAAGGFGADGGNLYFGAANANSYYFSGTFFEFRLMSRVLGPDEYLRQSPLRAYLPN